ncbi:CapA family protein [Streptomyces sp. NPDC046915]|uniref:CapA family protein n=1 Tax=Streptomyces sp. NPDC046915 TaxID=3155257 RepID=UPI0033E8F474
MIALRRQVALALTAVLAGGAACQAQMRHELSLPGPPGLSARPGRPAPPAVGPGFTLVASGAVLPDAAAVDRAGFDARGTGHDFRPMLAGSQGAVSTADLALCHLDTVQSAKPGTGGRPAAEYPPELAEALVATGYDSCSTAGRAPDGGPAAVRRTLDAMDRAGLRHTGTARTEAEARTLTILRAGPAKVAHLAYTDATDGVRTPPGQPWAANLIDEDRVLADARAARRAGADVVVVSLHWGTEGQDAPDRRQLTLADRLTAARTGRRPDIDLVLGTGAHVPQAYEKVNGTWVAYGLGDQITGVPPDDRSARNRSGNESTLGRFTFTPPARPGGRWEVTRAEFVPQMYDLDAGRVVDLGQAIAGGADLAGVRDEIRDTVLARGAAKDGLLMAR